MSCDATDVRLGAIAREIESLHGEWLVLMRRDATDVRLERLPAESSVYMGNGWISRVMRLNADRASPWGVVSKRALMRLYPATRRTQTSLLEIPLLQLLFPYMTVGSTCRRSRIAFPGKYRIE